MEGKKHDLYLENGTLFYKEKRTKNKKKNDTKKRG